ncbi:MAG: glycosyltransferase family 4 protein [Bacteroidales bacterium]|nr:glycosyltransferase family 4 protein [Bacteroidales bacterium]
MEKKKIIRLTTVPLSLNVFCKDLLKELSKDYEVVAVSSPGKDLEEVAQREGVRTIAIPIERRMSPFKDLKTLFSLIKIFKKEKPAMIHSMTPKAGLLGMMAAKFAGVKVRIHTFTGLVFPSATGIKRRILKFTDKLTCKYATRVIPEGKGVMKDLLENKVTKKPLKVLGNGNVRGVDMNYYCLGDEVKAKAGNLRKDDVFTFLFVGRVVADKGINELVEAFSKLYDEKPNIRLLLVGGFEEGVDPVSEKTKDLILNHEGISLYGWKDDVREFYAASDCFVLPSYREGFPNSVLEAGAMGKPCIVTDINGANEIIVEGENGLIVPPKNAEAIYSAMKRIFEDKDLYNKLQMNARPMVESRFERGYVWSCLKDCYKEELKDV